MAMTSTPLSSSSFRPTLQSSSSSPANPWNLNPSGPLPTPYMGEPSSWPPLPSSSSSSSSSQMHVAVDPPEGEGTADVPAAVAVEPISNPPVTAPEPDPIPDQNPPVPAPEPDPIPDQKPPVTAPEPDPIPDQKQQNAPPEQKQQNAPPEKSDAAPGPNHQRSRNRHNNYRRPQQQGSGRRGPHSFHPHSFHSSNGDEFYGWPPLYWNAAWDFGPIWPHHNCPHLNYYDANFPHYQGSFNPGLDGLFVYDPYPLPLSAAPAPADLGPRLPRLTEDQRAELPLTEDQREQKAVLEHQNLMEELRLQIEYYFSDDNLARDVYLRRQMDDQGWVDIHTIAKFNKVAAKTADLEVICKALSSSDNVELQGGKIRKKHGWKRFCIPRHYINSLEILQT